MIQRSAQDIHKAFQQGRSTDNQTGPGGGEGRVGVVVRSTSPLTLIRMSLTVFSNNLLDHFQHLPCMDGNTHRTLQCDVGKVR